MTARIACWSNWLMPDADGAMMSLLQSDEDGVPVFGVRVEGATYHDRPAAYAVVKDVAGRVAAVQGNKGYFLPGGGALPGETPDETISREVREELARNVQLIGEIGQASQYFFADERHYRMQAVFYAAEFVGEATGVGEHQLLWLEPCEFDGGVYHPCHAWAVAQSADVRP
jgi:8-oxo-dGTP pyrophosphatase MutT (NUDIX family)